MRYPNPAAGALIDCPVHQCVVVLDDAGRIKTRCPACINEARKARRRFATKRYRAKRRALHLAATERAEAS